MYPVFLNIQSTGLSQQSEIISLALTNLYGDYLYVEMAEFARNKCNQWVEDNVIAALKYQDDIDPSKHKCIFDSKTPSEKNTYEKFIVEKSNRPSINSVIQIWLSNIQQRNRDEQLTIVTDCGAHSWVYFCELFGGFLDEESRFPSFVNPIPHDINQDLARYMNITSAEAYQIDRQKLLSLSGEVSFNSLEKAIVTKNLWVFLNKIKVLILGNDEFEEDKKALVRYFLDSNCEIYDADKLWQENKSDDDADKLIMNGEIDFVYLLNGTAENNDYLNHQIIGFMKLAHTFGIPLYCSAHDGDPNLETYGAPDLSDWITAVMTPQEAVQDYLQ